MCGIAGCFSHLRLPENISTCLQRLAHRGPDDAGFYTHSRNIWLGNTRLAIQDLSHRGHQPMRSDDGRYTLVYNGELYNNAALRQELIAKGCTFHSDADTETLLQAYIHFGTHCLQKLNGIFAFAIFDQVRDELFVARDPLGVKPLYLYQDNNHWLFASELKALLNIAGLDYQLDPTVFYNYLLLLYNPEHTTPFKNISKLAPGHCITIKSGIPEQPVAFYRPPFNGQYDHQATKKEWINRTDKALQQSVAAQMISDAPVGFFLSGGLDSSLITAIARKQLSAQKPVCFTIDTGDGLRKEGFADDLDFARLAAKKLDVDLIEIPGKIDLAAELDSMIWHLDEPEADPAALHVLHIAKSANQRGIKVLMSGAGADDVFSGYRRHQALNFERWTNLFPNALLSAGAEVLNVLGRNNDARRVSRLTFAEGNQIKKRIGAHFWLQPERIRQLFSGELRKQFSTNQAYQYFEGLLDEIPAEQNVLNQLLYWELRTFLPQHNLNYTDKMSMAASVETRVPYLDTHLIALSTQMPPALKMNGRETKHILREVAKNYLPDEIIYRKKTGFGAPLRQWIKGELKTMIPERLLSEQFKQWKIFDTDQIAQLISENEQGKTDGAYTIFALLCIESWLRQFAGKTTLLPIL